MQTRGLNSIPEIIAKIAKEAIRERSVWKWRFRNTWVYAMDGGLTFREKDIHGQKNPHECGGTLPAYIFVLK